MTTIMSGNSGVSNLQSYNFVGVALIESAQYEQAVAVLTEATLVQRAAGPSAQAFLKVGELHLRTAQQRLEAARN